MCYSVTTFTLCRKTKDCELYYVYMAKKKLELSDEERQRRRELAKKMVEEGKIGGPRPGSGRPRKKRASEYVAEAARTHANKIVDAFLDSIHETAPAQIRLQAAKDWLLIEQKEAEIQLKEERQFDDMSEKELREMVAANLTKLHEKNIKVAVGSSSESEEPAEIAEAEIVEEEAEDLGEYEEQPQEVHESPFARRRE